MTPDIALAMIDARGHEAPSALSWLAAYNFIHNPNDAETHEKDTLSYAKHIVGEPDIDFGAEDLARRATLAGTMSVTYRLIGSEVLHEVQAGGFSVYFGRPQCYVFTVPNNSSRYITAPYPANSARDTFMRAVVMFADNGQHVRSAFPQYEPVWRLEEGIRQDIERGGKKSFDPSLKRHAFKGFLSDPVSPKRILQTGSVFWRHIMHGLLIVGDKTGTEEASLRAHDSIEAFEAAAAFPRALQRRAMGVPLAGSSSPQPSAAPHALIKDKLGRPRFRGLAHTPKKPSLCTGRGVYSGPEDWMFQMSAIAALVDLGALVAKQTIWASHTPR